MINIFQDSSGYYNKGTEVLILLDNETHSFNIE